MMMIHVLTLGFIRVQKHILMSLLFIMFFLPQKSFGRTVNPTLFSLKCSLENNSLTFNNVEGEVCACLWSFGHMSTIASGLSTKTYTGEITDADLLDVNDLSTVVVTAPVTSLTSTSMILKNVSCNGGNDGSIGLNIVGGTVPYTYLWSNGATTSTVSGLSAGTYSVTITDADASFIEINGIVVNEPAVFANASTAIQNVTCNGYNDGSVFVNSTGGTAPYTYSWSNGQTNVTATNLVTGAYSVTVMDLNNCSYIIPNLFVNEPDELVVDSVVIVNTTCFDTCDGSVSIQISGGTSPNSYDWSGIIMDDIDGDGTPSIFNLCKGFFNVEVTDVSGCLIVIDSIEITEPTPMYNNDLVVGQVTCNGFSNGFIEVDVFGGIPPYVCLWSNGETTDVIADLATGIYSVAVTDENGCEFDIDNILISEPLLLEVQPSTTTNVSCNGVCDGAASINITGGSEPYTYNWHTGGNTASIMNVCAGTHTATVTDIKGCEVDVTDVVITEPNVLVIQMNAINVSCFSMCNGSAEAVVLGGTTPYDLSWNVGQGDVVIDNLCADTYVLNVIDANGCPVIDSAVITQPSEIIIQASATDASCFGVCDGTASVVVVGGVAPYAYRWSNGASLMSPTSLCAGDYMVTVTDANNCIVDDLTTVDQPDEIDVQLVIDYGTASITATAQNGVSSYVYSWNTGSTGAMISNLSNELYIATATDNNGCATADSIAYVKDGGIISQFTISVGPNPFVNQAKMSVTSTISTSVIVQLFDGVGNVIERSYEGVIDENQLLEFTIDGSQLMPGMYLYRVMAGDGSTRTKRVILIK